MIVTGASIYVLGRKTTRQGWTYSVDGVQL